MEKLGFESFESDLCLFRHTTTGMMVLLYVDDLLVCAPEEHHIDDFGKAMATHFEIKEDRHPRRFLGFDMVRDYGKKTVFLSQAVYVEALLKKWDSASLSAAMTPWPSGLTLPDAYDKVEDTTKEYIKKTGSFNWLSKGTRPDITYTVSRLSEANSGPSKQHLDLMKHLIRYLRGTKDYGIMIGGPQYSDGDMNMRTFADAAFADDTLTRKSTGGHVVFVAGAPVIWESKKQTFVTFSTTEAEFANLTPAAMSTLWVQQVLDEAGARQGRPGLIFSDSQNAITHVLNVRNRARTRCIDVRYKWLIDRTSRGHFTIQHVGTGDMIADGLTKPLAKDKHAMFLRGLGLQCMPISWRDDTD